MCCLRGWCNRVCSLISASGGNCSSFCYYRHIPWNFSGLCPFSLMLHVHQKLGAALLYVVFTLGPRLMCTADYRSRGESRMLSDTLAPRNQTSLPGTFHWLMCITWLRLQGEAMNIGNIVLVLNFVPRTNYSKYTFKLQFNCDIIHTM